MGRVGSVVAFSSLSPVLHCCRMDTTSYVLIVFFSGLAFFSMGLAILLERGHGSDPRLRVALAPLAAFGLIHGSHEWLEMFDRLEILPWAVPGHNGWELLRIVLLATSFLSLGAFGATLLDRPRPRPRLRWLDSAALSILWALGIVVLLRRLPVSVAFWDAAKSPKYEAELLALGISDVRQQVFNRRDGAPAFYVLSGSLDRDPDSGMTR